MRKKRELLGKQLEEQDVLKEKGVKEQREFVEVSLPEVAGRRCDEVWKVQGREDLEGARNITKCVFSIFQVWHN